MSSSLKDEVTQVNLLILIVEGLQKVFTFCFCFIKVTGEETIHKQAWHQRVCQQCVTQCEMAIHHIKSIYCPSSLSNLYSVCPSMHSSFNGYGTYSKLPGAKPSLKDSEVVDEQAATEGVLHV